MPQQYKSILNITDACRKIIPAGQPFLKEDINPFTFRKLVAQRNIVEVGKTVEIKTPGGKKVTGPDSATPIGAIYPPKGDEEKLRAIENAKAELRTRNVKFHHNSGLELLLKKLDEDNEAKAAALVAPVAPVAPTAPVVPAKAPEAPVVVAPTPTPAAVPEAPKAKAAKVWDFDPATLQNLPLAQLVAKYGERSKEFKREIVTFDDRALLIAHMSSEFGK